MAWQFFPIVNGDNLQLDAALRELWVAQDERWKCLGAPFWPPQNSIHEWGDSFSLSGTHGNVTLTDSDKDWTTSAPAGCSISEKRWTNYTLSCPPQDLSNIIASYDVIFDHDDHRKVVRAQIVDNGINWLKLNLPIDSLIAQGVCASLSELTSRTYYIIKRDGLWHSDRWPNFANPNVEWMGQVESFATIVTLSTPPTQPLKGKTFAQAGKPDIGIIDAEADYLIIPKQTTNPSGAFTVKDGTTVIYSGTVSTLTHGIYEGTDHYSGQNLWVGPKPTSWTDGHWSGRDIVCNGSDGKVHRLDVTGNRRNVVTFSPPSSWQPAGSYVIVADGAFHRLDHQNMVIGGWYGGLREGYYAHKPDDSDPEAFGVVQKPMVSKIIKDSSTAEGCDDPYANHTKQAYDLDVWTSADNVCGGWTQAERCFSEDLYKTIRGLQNDVLGIGPSFVPVKEYENEAAIPNYVTARNLYDGNVNRFSSTTSLWTNPDTTEKNLIIGTFSGLPYSPIDAHYVVFDQYGDNWVSGTAQLQNGVPVNLGGNHDDDKAGRTVRWSYGLSRYVPLEFRFWPTYEQTIFIPQYETKANDIGIPQEVVYDPPVVSDFCHDDEEEPPEECPRDCFGTGDADDGTGWITRGGNQRYAVRSMLGHISDSGDTFQVGDVARFIGTNFSDGMIGPLQLQTAYGMSGNDKYYDRFYAGRHNPIWQSEHEKQKTGRVIAHPTIKAGSKSLTDTAQDWFDCWFGDAHLRDEIGTATGGSATTLTDTAKIPVNSGNGNPAACFWRLSRHLHLDEGYIGYRYFILEIMKTETINGTPQTVTYKTPITNVNPSTGTISFAAVTGLTITAGMSYRIQEPAELNKWRHRAIEITFPDGSKQTTSITHNDHQTLWFADALTQVAAEGTRYQIIEPIFGGVYKFDGTKWESTAGMSDPRGQPFKDDIRLNLPHKRKRYGSMMIGDYIHKELLNEIHRIQDRLRWTKYSHAWTNRADPATPEWNAWGQLSQDSPYGPCYTMDSFPYQTGDFDGLNGCFYSSGDNSHAWSDALACYGDSSRFGQLVPQEYFPGVEVSGPPAYSGYGKLGHDVDLNGYRNYAYGLLEGYARLLPSAKDFYAMGWRDYSDSDEQTGKYCCENNGVNPCCAAGDCGFSGVICPDASFVPAPCQCWEQRAEPYSQDYRLYTYEDYIESKFDPADTGLILRKFHKFSTVEAGTEARILSERLGSVSSVPPVHKPHDYSYCIENDTAPTHTGQVYVKRGRVSFGHYAAKGTVVCRFDVPGGLTKVT